MLGCSPEGDEKTIGDRHCILASEGKYRLRLERHVDFAWSEVKVLDSGAPQKIFFKFAVDGGERVLV